MSWQVLDLLNYEGKVSTERGAFSIDGRRVPLDSLSTALIGPKCSFSSGVPHHAAKHDVVVLFCDWRGLPLSALMPWSDNTRTGARMQAQATLSEPPDLCHGGRLFVLDGRGSACFRGSGVVWTALILCLRGAYTAGDDGLWGNGCAVGAVSAWAAQDRGALGVSSY